MAKAKTIAEEIQALRSRSTLTGKRKRMLEIYTGSLNSRLVDIQYALSSIELYSKESTEILDPFTALQEKREFYTTVFWALCYSSFDILAHIINTCLPVVADESRVSFGSARHGYNKLKQDARGPLPNLPQNVVDELRAIDARQYFSRLKSYRQCCLHRRAVCTAEHRATVTLSQAYSGTTGSGLINMQLYLCDDPDDMIPKFTKNRSLLKECSTVQTKMHEDILMILRLL